MSTLERPLDRFGVAALRSTVTTYRDAVRAHAAAINRLNVYPVPDGDTGTNMARTLDAVVDAVQAAPAELGPTCEAISHGSLMGARGNSGVILSQVLRGMAGVLREGEAEADAPTMASALRAAADAAYLAVATPVEGTILTVARESADAAERAAVGGATLAEVLRAARDEGRASLARTPDLLAVLRDAGVVDAGGAGLLLLLDAALHVVAGDPLPEAAADGDAAAVVAAPSDGHRAGAGDQRYEVMFFCDLADARMGELKRAWAEIGDSIVVVGGDGLWNCHVHSNDIGGVIEAALDVGGRPRGIRVTDLFEEVAAEHALREAELAAGAASPAGRAGTLPAVTTAVVAVSSGDGIAELFRELGVQAVVTGGQTLNPSTAELLAAVERVNAAQVVVLPNNKNIVAVAEQLDALTTRTVRVVPTRSMPEAIGALMSYDPEADAPTNAAAMRHGADAIRSGEVTTAVRDSVGDGGPIAAGDMIGIVRGDGVVASGATAAEAAVALLDRLLAGGGELVTVLTGADADEASTDVIVGWLRDHHADVQVEVHHGGQPLYPYLFGVE